MNAAEIQNAINKDAKYSRTINHETSGAEINVRNRELDASWAQFQEMHKKAMYDREHLLDHTGRAIKYYQVRQAYLDTSVVFAEQLERVRLNTLQRRYTALGRLIINVEKNASKRMNTIGAEVAATQLRVLEDFYGQFKVTIVEALAAASTDADAMPIINWQADICDSYLRSCELLMSFASLQYSQSSNSYRPLIVEFDGTLARWKVFRQAFEQGIESIPDDEKLLCLKSSLQGEAEHFVAESSFEADNYDTVWNRVKARYEKLTRAPQPCSNGKSAELEEQLDRSASSQQGVQGKR